MKVTQGYTNEMMEYHTFHHPKVLRSILKPRKNHEQPPLGISTAEQEALDYEMEAEHLAQSSWIRGS